MLRVLLNDDQISSGNKLTSQVVDCQIHIIVNAITPEPVTYLQSVVIQLHINFVKG